MATNSPQEKGHHRVASTLDALIPILDIAKNVCPILPAQAAFGSVGILLTMTRDTMANEQDYVDLGSTCAHVCKVLDRGLNGKQSDELSQSVLEAIQGLTDTATEIQGRVAKYGERNAASRFLQVKRDRGRIVGWRQNLQMILQVFNTELLVNNHTILLDIRHDVRAGQEDSGSRPQATQTKIPLGELPPSSPRAFFGRDLVVEKIVELSKTLTPVALIGPGGIGKTSIALTILHNDSIVERFGVHRRFIRCDQFPATRTNLLSRLSKVTGANVENPEDLAPLRSFLSSREILIVLDNAESILDPQGTDAKGIYDIVKELSSEFDNIFLVITSRITAVPPDCQCLRVPTLSIDAARDTLLRIYNCNEQPDLIDKILQDLDFHPLSVTLLATVARENDWNNDRLGREWEKRQTGVLRTEHNSLAAAVELSLASPSFKKLGPDARELLGVIAFYPQGVNENNVDWLFATLSNTDTILDKLCILSLTYRSNGYVTMLAPLRDHFRPQDPRSSPLLCATKGLYFTRLSVDIDPDAPGFEAARWIVFEDVNVEHLLDVFTSIDGDSDDSWFTSIDFMQHLFWHKPRQTVLRSKIEQLSDDRDPKPKCLLDLARLFETVGNPTESKRLITHTLKLGRERGEDELVAETLPCLSIANLTLGLYKEGIQQAREALEMYERLGNTTRQPNCSLILADLLRRDKQLDEAEEVALHSINNLPKRGREYCACGFHRLLGDVYRAKGEGEKTIHHYNEALHIACAFNLLSQAGLIHQSLAIWFFDQAEFDDAHTHINQGEKYVIDDPFLHSRTTEMRAWIWYRQRRFEDAISEALRVLEVYEKVGAVMDMERVGDLLEYIEEAKTPQPSS